jgi:hypothetical protein
MVYRYSGLPFDLQVGDIAGYWSAEGGGVYAVPDNYFNVVNPPLVGKREPNVVSMLYSNQSLDPYPSNSTDIFNITSVSQATSKQGVTNYTQEI